MTRRLVALAAIVAAVGLFGPGVAKASAATCAQHQVVIIDWSTGADTVGGLNQFQCGGAEGLDFRVVYYLQIWNGANWITATCDNGLCSSTKPPSGNQPWGAGTSHGWTWTFSFAGQIDCRWFHPRAYAVFSNGTTSQTWTGPDRQTC